MEYTFRTLRADEIDVRVATTKGDGMGLLLYKDARCDMNILDETFGVSRWQRVHELINGNLFCSVGINFPDVNGYEHWVWKQDVGTESYTEKEKGQASDSFKRACFNWGIGRELYTAPFIWVTGCDKYDKFKVKEIAYSENRKINKLVIVKVKYDNETVVYEFGTGKPKTEAKAKTETKPKAETKAKSEPDKPKTDERMRNIDLMYAAAENNGFNKEELTIIVMGKYKIKPSEMSSEQAIECANNIVTSPVKLKHWIEKQKEKGIA